MIANKHTELRLVSNLNDLLEDSKTRQDVNKKIHKHTFNYIMTYVSDNDLEDKTIYDKLEEISSSYQKHCYKIAKLVKEEILEENGEEIDNYYDSDDKRGYYSDTEERQVKKEIYLNPDKFTQEFQDNLEEELANLVVENFFKELNNVIKVFEFNDKINNSKKRHKKKLIEDNKMEIDYIMTTRLQMMYEHYLGETNGNAQLVIDNFKLVQRIKNMLLNDILMVINDYLDNEQVNKEDIETLFNKHLNAFVKEKQGIINATIKQSYYQPQQVQTTIQIPKSVQAYLMASVWEDITK